MSSFSIPGRYCCVCSGDFSGAGDAPVNMKTAGKGTGRGRGGAAGEGSALPPRGFWRRRSTGSRMCGPRAGRGSKGNVCSFISSWFVDWCCWSGAFAPPRAISCWCKMNLENLVQFPTASKHAAWQCYRLYGLVMDGPVIDLYIQSQKLIASRERAESDKCTYCKAAGAGRPYIFISSSRVAHL